jgi:hypothetical protein
MSSKKVDESRWAAKKGANLSSPTAKQMNPRGESEADRRRSRSSSSAGAVSSPRVERDDGGEGARRLRVNPRGESEWTREERARARAAAAASREERLRTLDHGGQAQSRSALCAFQSGLATILRWAHLSQALKLGQATKHGAVDSNGPGRALGQGTKHIHILSVFLVVRLHALRRETAAFLPEEADAGQAGAGAVTNHANYVSREPSLDKPVGAYAENQSRQYWAITTILSLERGRVRSCARAPCWATTRALSITRWRLQPHAPSSLMCCAATVDADSKK